MALNAVTRETLESDLKFAERQVWGYVEAGDRDRERIWRRFVTELRAKLR